jgi:hypothetical protein
MTITVAAEATLADVLRAKPIGSRRLVSAGNLDTSRHRRRPQVRRSGFRHRGSDRDNDRLAHNNADFRFLGLVESWLGLTHGALRMNAATRVNGLMADRAAEPGRDRSVEVFGIHPKSSAE